METLTFSQVEEKYNGNWVLLSEIEHKKNKEIKKCKVVYCNHDKNKVYQKAMNLKDKHIAVFYIGKDDLVYMFRNEILFQ